MSVSGRRKPVHRRRVVRVNFSADWTDLAVAAANLAASALAVYAAGTKPSWKRRKRIRKRARQRRVT